MTPGQHSRQPDEDDESLIDRANDGDGAAFGLLYRRHRDFALRVAWRITGDSDLAAEAVQDAFLWWMRQFPGFELRAAVTTYLYRIVRSRAIDAARRRDRVLRMPSDPEMIPAAPLPRTSDSDAPSLDALAADINRLPFVQQEVLLLRFGHDMSDAEIAAALDQPLGTIKGRIRSALAALHERLQPPPPPQLP